MIANHAEVEFLADGEAIPAPRFTENVNPGVHRIGMWFPVSQFDRIAAILRQGRGLRCFCFERKGKEPVAGIKDWNTLGGPRNQPDERELLPD